MKITALELHGFRSYRNLRVPFHAWRTLVIGRNGSGKTTLADAMLWILTGKCRGLDGAGRGSGALIRQNMSDAIGMLDVAGLGLVIRTTNGKDSTLEVVKRVPDGEGEEILEPIIRGAKTDVQAAIYQKLGVREEILEAALDSSRFLALDHKEAKELLMRILNVRVPVDEALRTRLAPVCDEDPGDALTLNQVDELERKARDKRLVAKQRLKDLGAPREPVLPPALQAAPSAAEIQAKIARLKSDAADLFAKAQQRAGARKGLLERKTRLEADLKRLDQALLGVDVDATRERLEALEADRAAAIGLVDRDKLQGLRERIAETRGTLTATEEILIKVRKHSPASGCVLDSAIPCKTPASAFKAYLKTVDGKRKQLQDDVNQTGEEMVAIQEAADRLDALNREERTLKASLEGVERNDALREEKRSEMTAVLADLETYNVPEDPRLEEKRQAIEKLETLLGEWRNHDARVQAFTDASAKLEKYARDVERLEELCQLLGPKGLRVQALTDAVDRFETKANGFLKGWSFAIKITPEPWGVTVNGRPAAMLSKSERLRLGIGLQLAIVETADLGFAFIDEADVLDKINNNVLAQLLLTTGIGPEGSAGQIIVAATRDDEYTPPNIPELQVVRLAKAMIRPRELETILAPAVVELVDAAATA